MAKIIFGSDHAGFNLKQSLQEYVQSKGFEVQDVGPQNMESCDYPTYAKKLCAQVLSQDCIGILICGSGLGMSMTANRIPGIRAALCTNEFLARMSRRHNNANVLCLGERVIGIDLAQSIVDAFLQAEFEGGRHLRRVEAIENN